MKEVVIKIPCSWKDVKILWNEHVSRRNKHNAKVIRELEKRVKVVINSGYWDKDVSEYFRKHVFNHRYSNGLRGVFDDAISKLK